jgi:anhydro-N-acetylmuramic acid kinase
VGSRRFASALVELLPILPEISTLVASGGGVRNEYLMKQLAARMPLSLRLTGSDEFGIPVQYKEALKFAALAIAAKLTTFPPRAARRASPFWAS